MNTREPAQIAAGDTNTPGVAPADAESACGAIRGREDWVNTQLDLMTKLEDGWGGPTSKRPHVNLFFTLGQLHEDIAARDAYFGPTAEGGIRFEFKIGDLDHTVEFTTDETWLMALGDVVDEGRVIPRLDVEAIREFMRSGKLPEVAS